MTTTDEQYVPSEDNVRARYAFAGLPDYATSDQVARARDREAPEFDRFLARVRRDAAAEAWSDCVSEASALGWLHPSAALDMLDRNPHEEAP